MTIDTSILKKLPNMSPGHYHSILTEEFSMFGAKGKPDFGSVQVEIIPSDFTIELKSWKLYLLEYRNQLISYEGTLEQIHHDLVEIYKPLYIRVTLTFHPRGGISSILYKESGVDLRDNLSYV